MDLYILIFLSIIDIIYSVHCPLGGNWVNLNGNCVLWSSQQLSWNDAIKECQHFSATLLQFYDLDTKAQFMNLTQNLAVERWWTGLNDYDHPGTWVWGPRGSEFEAEPDILEWNVEPDDTKHLENCGALNIQGTVSDQKCSERHGYICEYSRNGNGCEFEWMITETSCYYFSDFNDPYNVISWSDANNRCKQLSANATLLKLETLVEQAYITLQLPVINETSKLWWIGMTDQAKEGQWLWVDGTLVTSKGVNWAVEPNNLAGKEKCAMLYHNGRFADKECSLTANYACNTPATGFTDNILKNKLGCLPGWTRAGHKCYLFQDKVKLKWSDATDACNQFQAWTLQVTSLDEKNFIQTVTSQIGRTFWTGLNYHTSTKQWFWSTGIQANKTLIRWNSEPNNYAGNEDCAVILQDSSFNDDSCFRKTGYICELQSEDSPCAAGWLSRSDEGMYSCYYISNTTSDAIATWDEARAKCKQVGQPMDAYLFAINDEDELEFIYHALQSKPKTAIGWWTGLNDRKIEGTWEYDTSFNTYKPDVIPWNSEPNNAGGKDFCACIYSGGRFNDLDCSVKLGYICEMYAAGQASSKGSLAVGKGHFYKLFFILLSMKLTKIWHIVV